MADSPQDGVGNSPSAGFRSRTDAIRVLFVEDDELYREALAGELSDHGFAVEGFADAASLAVRLDGTADFDLILLDWALPHTSRNDLLSELRRRGIDAPVVFLTGNGLTANERLAFERGAIDFIDKTRGGEVLVRRLRLVVDSTRPPAIDLQPDERLICGKLLLRPAIGRAYDVGLTVGEYNIVHLLASNVGIYLSYRAIYDRMHYEGFIAGSGDDGYRTNVRSTIKRIRNKFREIDPTFEEIKNSVALGYCWATQWCSPTKAPRSPRSLRSAS
jgi:two-component system, OmpR family, response regulator ChvI